MASAVQREADWLTTTGDGLPSLLKANGGPWDVVQAYMQRTPPARQTALWVLRGVLADTRFAQQRRIQTHAFRVVAWWPLGATTTSALIAETEQAALDAALDLLLTRIRGFVTDHSHGNRFLDVAEGPPDSRIQVVFDDPLQTMAATPGFLRATVTYSADDADFTA